MGLCYGRSVGTAPPIVAEWLGRIGYREAWARQKGLLEQRAAGEIDDRILLLEHDPVLTLGRGADAAHVLASPRELGRRGIEVIRVERGGEVTYHGPGQLVGYPIVKLPEPLDVVGHVRRIEEALIGVCADFNVEAARVEGRSGVWVLGRDGQQDRKVAAIGIRVSHGVTMHGFALNCDCDLTWFDRIVPCGLPDATVTSLTAETGHSVTVSDVLPYVEKRLDAHLIAPVVNQ